MSSEEVALESESLRLNVRRSIEEDQILNNALSNDDVTRAVVGLDSRHDAQTGVTFYSQLFNQVTNNASASQNVESNATFRYVNETLTNDVTTSVGEASNDVTTRYYISTDITTTTTTTTTSNEGC